MRKPQSGAAWLLGATFAVLVAALGGQAAAEPVAVPGTRVSLEPPSGFVAARQFPGFQQSQSGASILVTEIAGPVDQVSAGFNEQGLASKGMALLSKEPVDLDGHDAQLLRATQVVQGIEFHKWIAVFGDRQRTAIVIATFPTATVDSLAEPLRQSLLSTRWDPAREVGPFDGLPFRVSETDSFKVASRLANTILMNAGGDAKPTGLEDPLVVVAASLGEVAIGDIETFARKRLENTAGITEILVVGNQALTLAGLPAYELIALAKDRDSDAELTVYQALAADGARYFLVQGFVARTKTESLLPGVRHIAESLEIVN